MNDTIVTVGRRKCAIARVFLRKGSGKLLVNGEEIADYLKSETLLLDAKKAFSVLENAGNYDVKINVCGGGLSGQAGAIRLGIARALVEADAQNRTTLKKAGLLTRDAREVERKKYGQAGARKRFQFSKR
ncbi:MAG: 30S ribosomal protein S9 [Chitinivibrionia bacterium]|nr:30S ribosomal protein S9 [Chitinivibrionia bacterium]MCL1947487.1 30S ribosomal protein S9 [Chitinivibrionia bacterium]